MSVLIKIIIEIVSISQLLSQKQIKDLNILSQNIQLATYMQTRNLC